jgi:hypothetical protein
MTTGPWRPCRRTLCMCFIVLQRRRYVPYPEEALWLYKNTRPNGAMPAYHPPPPSAQQQQRPYFASSKVSSVAPAPMYTAPPTHRSSPYTLNLNDPAWYPYKAEAAQPQPATVYIQASSLASGFTVPAAAPGAAAAAAAKTAPAVGAAPPVLRPIITGGATGSTGSSAAAPDAARAAPPPYVVPASELQGTGGRVVASWSAPDKPAGGATPPDAAAHHL